MHSTALMLASILLASAAYAGEPKAYQGGKLLAMDSIPCSVNPASAKPSAAQQSRCQEYLLESDQVVYRIRPRDAKHPALLPVGELAQFRFNKNKMLLRVDYIDGKEREYNIISISPRGDNTADAAPVHLNHLQ